VTQNSSGHSVDLDSSEEILDFVFFIVYKIINNTFQSSLPLFISYSFGDSPNLFLSKRLPGDEVYSFNGLRLNWPGSTGGYTSFSVDNDSLSELQVVTDSAQAEVAVGGVSMNLVTKSGANTMYGLAAFYYQSAGTQATISIHHGERHRNESWADHS
jgi:hypothetical protein